MKFELEEYHRGIADEELLSDLRRVASELNKVAITRDDYDQKGKYGKTTYIRRFGSWFKALEKAGLQKTRTPMNLPEQELFENLKEIWIKLGRQPRYAEVQKPLSKYHVGTYENRFGSWRKALRKFIEYINSDIEKHAHQRNNEGYPFEETPLRQRSKRQINDRLRVRVLIKDGNTCRLCRKIVTGNDIHIDHIMPWAKGGETVVENLQVLCSKCNLGKGDFSQ